jgi:hypothetical protein
MLSLLIGSLLLETIPKHRDYHAFKAREKEFLKKGPHNSEVLPFFLWLLWGIALLSLDHLFFLVFILYTANCYAGKSEQCNTFFFFSWNMQAIVTRMQNKTLQDHSALLNPSIVSRSSFGWVIKTVFCFVVENSWCCQWARVPEASCAATNCHL